MTPHFAHFVKIRGVVSEISIGPTNHRRSQGVQWVHLHPPGWRKKFFSGLIYRKMRKCTPGHEVHPQPKQESIFRPVYAGWLRLEVYLDTILIFEGRRLKKGRQLFLGKSAPQTKSWLRLWSNCWSFTNARTSAIRFDGRSHGCWARTT